MTTHDSSTFTDWTHNRTQSVALARCLRLPLVSSCVRIVS